MANLRFSTAIRNQMLESFNSICSSSATFTIYTGAQPAGGGTATTQLAQLVGAATFGSSAASGALTLSALVADANADASGTATWFRIANKNSDFCIDGDVSTAAAATGDLQLDNTSIIINGSVAISGPNVITAGNAA